jgi:dTDP-4-amino-4,6-dideoxygalactose transaminase
MGIPLVDLRSQQSEISDEVNRGLEEVFANTAFIGGPAVGEFEREYAAYVGVNECVGVANGTDALELALRAVGVRPGVEVVIPANTFIATAEAISRIGAQPVVVDVDSTHLLMDPEAVRVALTSRTGAIIPVHLFGQVAPMEELLKIAADAGVSIIEDAAQSQGAKRNGRSAGSFGDAAGTSFYPGKNLGAAGDAGAVLTDSPALARRVRVIAAHGSEHKYDHEVIGLNSRLDTIQAVVLRAKLARLDAWNESRQQAAEYYGELLAGVDGVQAPFSADGNEDVWHLYVVQVDERDRVLRDLHDVGIGAGVHYPIPIHLTGAYYDLNLARGACPVAEAAADRILSLPMHPHITRSQQDVVVEELQKALGRGRLRSSASTSR